MPELRTVLVEEPGADTSHEVIVSRPGAPSTEPARQLDDCFERPFRVSGL